jgi:hypothetical protein
MAKHIYMINSNYKLNANISVLQRKREDQEGKRLSRAKVLGEIVNQLVYLLSQKADSNYSVTIDGDCLVIRTFGLPKKLGKGND